MLDNGDTKFTNNEDTFLHQQTGDEFKLILDTSSIFRIGQIWPNREERTTVRILDTEMGAWVKVYCDEINYHCIFGSYTKIEDSCTHLDRSL